MTAATLVFVYVMKEMPIPLIIPDPRDSGPPR